MTIDYLMESRLWMAAGWTMLHFLWIGSILGVLAALGRIVLRSASANVRYAFGLVCLLALAAAPPIIGIRVLQASTKTEPLAAAKSLDRSKVPLIAPDVIRHDQSEADSNSPPRDTNITRSMSSSKDVALLLGNKVGYLPWLWLLGSPCVFALVATGLLGAERLKRQSRVLKDGQLPEICRRLTNSLQISRRVTVGICDRLTSPILLGVLRPMILLPPVALTGWSADQVEMVLLHELAHVRRWDNLVNLLQRIIESILFFHPAVWLVSGWVRAERECCCDSVVVAVTGRRLEYAETLASLVSSEFIPPSTAVAMAQRNIVVRISRILSLEDRSMKMSREFVGLSAVAVVGPLLLVTAFGRHADGLDSSEQESAAALAAIQSVNAEVDFRIEDDPFFIPGAQDGRPAAELSHANQVKSLYLDGSRVTDNLLSHLEHFSNLETLYLWDTSITDGGIAHLSRVPSLQALYLCHATITDAALEHLKELKNLQVLNVYGVEEITDAGLSKLQGLNLRYLGLNRTGVTNAGLTHLKGMTNLQTLHLGRTEITDAGIAELVGLTDLRSLALKGAKITDDGIATLLEFPRLEELTLGGPDGSMPDSNLPQVTGKSLAQLKRISTLRSLGLTHAAVTDDDLVHLAGMTNLERLSLTFTHVTGAGLVHLKDLTKLKGIGLNIENPGDEVLATLGRMKNLESLTLFGVGDEDLAHISGLRNLQGLRLRSEEITDQGLEHLKELKKLRVLNLSGDGGGTRRFSAAATEHLKGLVQLEELTLYYPATDSAAANLKGLTKLRRLGLDVVTDDTLAELTALKELEWLWIGQIGLTNEGLRHLQKLPNLRTLHLRSRQVTDDGVPHLMKLTNLKFLGLPRARFTSAGIARLHEALPDCEIPSRGFGGASASDTLGRLDADNDGKLTKNEIPERFRARLMLADTNKDGVITGQELTAFAD